MLQKNFILLVLIFCMLWGKENEISFRAMPTVSSNPTAGTGVGATGMMVYKLDNSFPSQTILAAQYTNTDSYNIFFVNKMFFQDNTFQSNTIIGNIYNNSNIDIGDYLPVTAPISKNAAFDVTIYVAAEQLLYKVHPNIYVGGQLIYVDQSFRATNSGGEAFLRNKGIEDAKRFGYGVTLSYDTRSKTEQFYPRDASLINFMLSNFPESGTDIHYYNALLNARNYRQGLRKDDVLALQLFAQYSSENTPDGALAALGARNILRGFVIGEYKARNMLATQAEYRYKITNSDFRLTAFGGYALLTGGSAGTDLGNRDVDNGSYYSGGIGVHYIIQKKQNIDYRIDFAVTNTNDYGVYANINQAF